MRDTKSAPVPDTSEVPAARRTDPAEIERLFRQHNAALLRFVAAKLGSEQEAREVAQEAYVRLLRLDQLETISYLRAFLFRTAANLALDRLRARGKRSGQRAADDTEFNVFDLTPERHVAGEQAIEIMRRALAELPRKSREAFLLHRLHGLSQLQIAKRLGLKERMVRLHMARTLEHLRTRLDEFEGGAVEKSSCRKES